jgi:hypothetical protein
MTARMEPELAWTCAPGKTSISFGLSSTWTQAGPGRQSLLVRTRVLFSGSDVHLRIVTKMEDSAASFYSWPTVRRHTDDHLNRYQNP